MEMRSAILSFVLIFSISTARAQTSTWVPDKAHSEVDFSVLHLSLSNVQGRFGNLGGAILFDPSDISRSSVNVTIDVSTIDTGLGARDSALKSSTFLDVDRFPTATFVSTSVAKSGNGLSVTGNLTLHGVNKPIVLQVEGPNGPVSGRDRKSHIVFSATASLSRAAFGIATGYPTGIVADEVKLTIELDAVEQ
jgi:polyisoprenoid-binding protein YceI